MYKNFVLGKCEILFMPSRSINISQRFTGWLPLPILSVLNHELGTSLVVPVLFVEFLRKREGGINFDKQKT